MSEFALPSHSRIPLGAQVLSVTAWTCCYYPTRTLLVQSQFEDEYENDDCERQAVNAKRVTSSPSSYSDTPACRCACL